MSLPRGPGHNNVNTITGVTCNSAKELSEINVCLTGLFFQSLYQIMLVPKKPSKSEFLQAK